VSATFTEVIPGEIEAATKKVIIKKDFLEETEQKKINLNSVSATCTVMNL